MAFQRDALIRVMQVRLLKGEQGAQGNGHQRDGGKVRQPRRKQRGHQPPDERADDQGQATQQLQLAQTLLKGVAVLG